MATTKVIDLFGVLKEVSLIYRNERGKKNAWEN